MEKQDSKKFIAFLDDELVYKEDGVTGFYISDVDYWNRENYLSGKKYDIGVYVLLAELNCINDANNHFIVDKNLQTKEDLREFLSQYNWIKVISGWDEKNVNTDYPPFNDDKKRVLDYILENYKNKVTVVNYPLIDSKILSRKLTAFTRKNEGIKRNFTIGNEFDCNQWLKKMLDKDKEVVCHVKNRYDIDLYAFKEKNTYKKFEEEINAEIEQDNENENL